MTKKKAGAQCARVAKPSRVAKSNPEITAAQLTEMVDAATVDAYNESEQAVGWLTMLDEHLDLPFEIKMLGVR